MNDIKIEITKFMVKLLENGKLASKLSYRIEQPDEYIKEKYVSIFNVKTNEKYQRKGYSKMILKAIDYYVKNELNLNNLTLLVYKDNPIAYHTYLGDGFTILHEYEDSFAMVKKLK